MSDKKQNSKLIMALLFLNIILIVAYVLGSLFRRNMLSIDSLYLLMMVAVSVMNLIITVYLMARKRFSVIVFVSLILNTAFVGLVAYGFVFVRYTFSNYTYELSNEIREVSYPGYCNIIFIVFVLLGISVYAVRSRCKYRKIVIAISLLFLLSSIMYYAYLAYDVKGVRICPTSWVDNQMPTWSEPGSVPGDATDSQYLIVNGEHKSYKDMDIEWVKQSCSVNNPRVVY